MASSVKKYIEDMLGFTELKQQIQTEIKSSQDDLQKIKDEHLKEVEEAKAELERIKQQQSKELEEHQAELEKIVEEKSKITKTPKEIATERGEPYIAVLDTTLDKNNPRNGYFELDWNKPFIDDLIQHGFGFESDPEEEIVDRWFRSLASNMLQEADIPISPQYTGGYININQITKDHSEAS